jgi:hypothetical protein
MYPQYPQESFKQESNKEENMDTGFHNGVNFNKRNRYLRTTQAPLSTMSMCSEQMTKMDAALKIPLSPPNSLHERVCNKPEKNITTRQPHVPQVLL